MSSRSARASGSTEDEVINDLIFKLQASLPHDSNSRDNKKVSSTKFSFLVSKFDDCLDEISNQS